jgi:hypothetical protein
MEERSIIDTLISKERQAEIKEKCLDKFLLELMNKFDIIKNQENFNEVEIMYCLVKMGGMLQSVYEDKKKKLVLKALGIEE